MTGTGNEVAVREGIVITPAERAASATALADAGSIDSWLVVMKDVVLLAEHIADTSFVPKSYRGNAPAVAAAILAGRELGLQPMTALRHVQVVEGSPGLSAEYKRARVLAAGHKLDITEHTTEACTVTGHRKGHEDVTVRYTIQDAKRAGLVKDRGAYMTRPRRMLFARACTEVCDALFSDLTNGLPTAELLGEETDGVNGYDEQPAQSQRQRVTAADARARNPQTVTATVVTESPSPAAGAVSPSAAPRPQAAAAGEAPPVHDHSAPSAETESARKAAHAQARRVFGDDRDARLLWAARIITADDGDVKSFDYLTLEELRLVAGTLAKVRDAAELEALLKSGEVPGE